MGLRKRWAWEKIDWDERIYKDEVVFREDFIDGMNSSELVEILNLRGVRAHRGMDREELVGAFFGSLREVEVVIEHPVDFLRRRIRWFIELHWERIRDQLTTQCDQRCFNKHDAEVLFCYTAPLTKRNIEKEMEKHGYED